VEPSDIEHLCGEASRSLDLQYFIWQDDTTGQLLFRQLWIQFLSILPIEWLL
jgi:hypothetical protein